MNCAKCVVKAVVVKVAVFVGSCNLSSNIFHLIFKLFPLDFVHAALSALSNLLLFVEKSIFTALKNVVLVFVVLTAKSKFSKVLFLCTAPIYKLPLRVSMLVFI